MKIYMVGGCVRDMILGREPKDLDFVVVGSTPEEMLNLGFEQVGASFPVFLMHGHIRPGEYALARTERKIGVGYQGFETKHDANVTLLDDLRRRDLTINSMAYDEDTEEVIDPYNGRADLEAGILRHTSEAFAEDPVRVLRTARFAARYGFTIADETLDLMEQIVPEIDHVPAERIWAEVEKGLMEAHPEKMFLALESVGAFHTESMKPFAHSHLDKLETVKPEHDLVTRFTLVSSGFEDKDFIECRVPNDCAIVARTFNKYFPQLTMYAHYNKEQRLMMLQDLRAFSNRWLLEKCLEVIRFYGTITPTEEWIAEDLKRLSTVDAAAIAATCSNGQEIKNKLFKARVAVL